MNPTLKNIVKNGLIMFAVGMALAMAAPAIAEILTEGAVGEAAFAHATALGSQVLWTGAFFGAFGAIHSAMVPMFDAVFGGEKPQPAQAAVAIEKSTHCPTPSVDVNIANTQIDIDAKAKIHAQMIQNERTESPSSQLSRG